MHKPLVIHESKNVELKAR